MKVSVYLKHNGSSTTVELPLLPEEEQWFTEHEAKLSMEESGGLYTLYADIGLLTKDGEPDEVIAIVNPADGHHAGFHKLKLLAEELLHDRNAK